jgi:small-conductance mechanosensitive channel
MHSTFTASFHWLSTTELLGIALTQWALFFGASVLAFLLMSFALRVVCKQLGKRAAQTHTHLDDITLTVLGGTQRGLIAVAAIVIGLGVLDLPDRWEARISQLWFIALTLQIALWINRAVTLVLQRHVERRTSQGTANDGAPAALMSWGIRTALWTIVLLAILSNLGINITAFVASLGVGGIAVALAVQNILGDLFASLSIAVDKPFEVGDFIVVDTIAGTVEKVGLKTTRIRSLSGEQIVTSNTELLKRTVSNYKRLEERRIVFKFSVGFEATTEQLAEIPRRVRRIVESNTRLRFDRAHLQALSAGAIDFEVVYIVLDADYNLYMDFQQDIYLALLRDLESLGVALAYPTRTVHLRGLDRLQDDEAEALHAPPRGGPRIASN